MDGASGYERAMDMMTTRLRSWMFSAVMMAALVTTVSAQPQNQPAEQPTTQQPTRRVAPVPEQQEPSPPPQPKQPDRIDQLIKGLDPAILSRLTGADVTVEIVGNQVILQGPEEAVKAIELLIRALEMESEVRSKVLEIVQVTERDAKEIARDVQTAVRDAKKFPAQKPEEQISITALSANILLVAALPEDLEQVLEIIKQVDSIPDPLGKIEPTHQPLQNSGVFAIRWLPRV